jgi:hypothetical protein
LIGSSGAVPGVRVRRAAPTDVLWRGREQVLGDDRRVEAQ